MNHRGSVNSAIILATAIIIVFAGIAAYALATSENHDNHQLTEGYWYEVGYYTIMDDGTYAAIDEKAASADTVKLLNGVDIVSVQDGMFSATCLGYLISGTCDADGTVRSCARVMNDEHVFIYGNVADGVFRGVLLDDDDSGYSVSYIILATDRNVAPSNPQTADISGDWVLLSGDCVSYDGTVSTVDGTQLTVNEQKNSVFSGTMQQQIAGAVTDVAFCGAFTGLTVDGYRLALLADDRGVCWTATIRGNNLNLQTCLTDTKADDPAQDDCVAVERFYGRTAETAVAHAASPDLTGKTWYVETSEEMTNTSRYTQSYIESQLTITACHGTLLTGTLTTNAYTYGVTAFVCGNQIEFYYTYTFGDYLWYGTPYTARLDGEQLTTYSLNSGTSTTRTEMTEKVYTFADVDITQHWLCVSTYGITLHRNILESVYSTGMNNDLLFDLDIFAAKDGLFNGTFRDAYVSGTYTNDGLSFTAVLGDGSTVMFYAHLMSSGVMISQELYILANGDEEAWESVYSLTNLHTDYEITDSDPIYGEWNSPDGYSFLYYTDGTQATLDGHTLELSRRYFLLTGTMEQEVNGEVAEKKVVGSYLRGYHGSDNNLILIDDTGIVYHGLVIDGTLFLSTSTVTDTGQVGERIAADRIYSRTDDAPTVPTFASYAGTTWQSTSSTYLAGDGSTGGYGSFTVAVEKQYENLISGTVTIDGKAYEMVGYISVVGDMNELILSFYDGTPYQGESLVLNGDGSAVLYGHTGADGSPLAYVVHFAAP